MTIIKVTAFEAAAGPVPSVRLAVKKLKAGLAFMFSIPLAAQESLFGRAMDPTKDALLFHLDDHQKKRHLLMLEIVPREGSDGLAILPGIKDSVKIMVTPWTDASIDARPAVSLETINQSEGAVTVKLPEWARTPLPKPGQGPIMGQ